MPRIMVSSPRPARAVGGSTMAPPRPASRPSRWLGLACWAYLASVLGAWAVIQVGEERWWPVTLLLYAPRWPWGLPLAALAPASMAFRGRALVPLAAGAMVLVGPIMGFRVPPAWGSVPGGPGLRVLTLNTQGEHLDPAAFRALIAVTWPDLVLLQEWAGGDASATFPRGAWDVRESPGLLLASRWPVLRDESLPTATLDERGRAARFEVLFRSKLIRVANLHLATPRVGLQAILDDRRGGVETLREGNQFRRKLSDLAGRWVLGSSDPTLVAGDFNLTTDSAIFRASWSSMTDAFEAAGTGFGSSKFTRWHGVRIDHILASPGWTVRRCWVGPDVGSDHRAVLADLVLGPDPAPGRPGWPPYRPEPIHAPGLDPGPTGPLPAHQEGHP